MGTDFIPPNEVLATARLNQEKTLDEVSSALNLPLHAIKALEAGEFEKLHGEAFVTGYMRSYARLLALPDDQIETLIESYLKQVRPKQSLENYTQPEMLSNHLTALFQHKQYKTAYGLIAVGVLFAFLGFITVEKTPTVAIVDNDTLQLQTAAGLTVISSLQDLPAENPTLGLLPEIKVSDNKQLKQRLELGLTSNLSFRFKADCWVEILDGNDEIIFSALQKAEQDLELSGKPPFRITLGYAPGVELSYNGQPVKLNANRTDLVKLVLGNS